MATIAELEQRYLTGEPLCAEIARLQGTDEQVMLAFSTGKDCLAAWVCIRECFQNIIPFYLYLVPDLEFIEESLAYYEKVLGTHIVRLPSPQLYTMINDYVYQSPERIELIDACRFPKFTYDDVRQVLCEDLQLPADTYYATGVRAPDSPMRMTAISSYGPITHSRNKFHPVWNWNKARLIEELTAHKIRLPVDYKLFSRSWDGIDLRFIWSLKKVFPADYRRILNWFPLVELEVSRYEFHLRKKTVDDLRQTGATDQQIYRQVQQMKKSFTYEDHP